MKKQEKKEKGRAGEGGEKKIHVWRSLVLPLKARKIFKIIFAITEVITDQLHYQRMFQLCFCIERAIDVKSGR